MLEGATGVYSMHNAHFAGLCEELLRGEREEGIFLGELVAEVVVVSEGFEGGGS